VLADKGLLDLRHAFGLDRLLPTNPAH